MQDCHKLEYSNLLDRHLRKADSFAPAPTGHSSFLGSLWFQWDLSIPHDQRTIIHEFDVFFVKFPGAVFEIWQPWHLFFNQKQFFLVDLIKLLKIMEQKGIFYFWSCIVSFICHKNKKTNMEPCLAHNFTNKKALLGPKGGGIAHNKFQGFQSWG